MTSDPSDLYLIWSITHCAWWGEGGDAYTTSLSQAGRYSRRAAIDICVRSIPARSFDLGARLALPVRLEDFEAIVQRYRIAHALDIKGVREDAADG
jgi:hypothetical protein